MSTPKVLAMVLASGKCTRLHPLTAQRSKRPVTFAGGATRSARARQGNDNAHFQDNDIPRIDWSVTTEKASLMAFVQRMPRIRREHPVFRGRNFFQGRPIRGRGVKDRIWLTPGLLQEARRRS